MTAGQEQSWQEALAALVARAPDALRALASDQLHIGGFTNVQLEHPVLDVRAAAGADQAQRALVFFLAAALLGGARVARVHVAKGPPGADLARLARTRFRAALERVDDENLSLLRYFDVYLHPASALDDKTGQRIVHLVGDALANGEQAS